KYKPTIVDLLGGVFILFGLPPLTLYFWMCMNDFGGALVDPRYLLSRIPMPTMTAFLVYGAWFVLQVLLQIFAPGKVHEGVPLHDGSRLKYKMNGWSSWWFTLAVVAAGVASGWIPSTLLYDQFGPLLMVVNIFVFIFSF